MQISLRMSHTQSLGICRDCSHDGWSAKQHYLQSKSQHETQQLCHYCHAELADGLFLFSWSIGGKDIPLCCSLNFVERKISLSFTSWFVVGGDAESVTPTIHPFVYKLNVSEKRKRAYLKQCVDFVFLEGNKEKRMIDTSSDRFSDVHSD